MKDFEESGSGGRDMYDNLTKDDIKKMQEEIEYRKRWCAKKHWRQ